MQYIVNRLAEPFSPDADWDKPAWRNIPALELNHYMGDLPTHRPKTQAKLAYDDRHVYVIFHVQDQYVRAVAQNYQENVCRDSCVEFFFSPNADVTAGYFNVEINCGATMLLYHQTGRGENIREVDPAHGQQFQIASTLPKIIDPEITEPTVWTLEYRFPTGMLENYCPVTQPAPGVTWRANLYKCADHTSQPHWLTWAKIDLPQPDFHQPAYFATLTFK